MTVPASKSNSPLRRRTEKALKRLEVLAKKYETEGMTKRAARAKAQKEMRDNTRGDWRDG
jgi:hypothetical protein